jgi:hypothetical protein
MTRLISAVVLTVLLLTCSPLLGVEKRQYQMREDFGTEALEDCYLQYYYYVPCPTYSWFWGFYKWDPGDIIGQFFTVGDTPTGGWALCDTAECYEIMGVRVLDFAGYGIVYPGLFTVRFDVYCADENGCPVGGSISSSGPVETDFSWNDIVFDPSVDVSACYVNPGLPGIGSHARFLITATHIGTDATYPEWGTDNISALFEYGCDMHVYGCLPVLYPRPSTSHYTTMHSGYYGIDFQYCPPQLFRDGKDSTPDGSLYGYLELAWRVRVNCVLNETEGTTWGGVKSLYR